MTVRQLTAERLHTLGFDQRLAVRGYIGLHAGAEAAAEGREARYTEATDDVPSILEVRVTDAIEHPDGTVEPAAWFCAIGVGYPPAWKAWETVDPVELDETVTAEVVAAPAPAGRRRRR